MNLEELREWSDRLSRYSEDVVDQSTDELSGEIRAHTNRFAKMLRESTPRRPDLAAEARHTLARYADEPSGNMLVGELLWLASHIEKWSASREPTSMRRWLSWSLRWVPLRFSFWAD